MVNVALVRMFNGRFQTSGMGNKARVVSVTMLIAVSVSRAYCSLQKKKGGRGGHSPLLYRPIAVKVLLEKHFA
jgi:hypothetical protein